MYSRSFVWLALMWQLFASLRKSLWLYKEAKDFPSYMSDQDFLHQWTHAILLELLSIVFFLFFFFLRGSFWTSIVFPFIKNSGMFTPCKHWRNGWIIIIVIIIITIYSFRVFHISVSWWSFTGVWVTASLLKSPGLSSVFWPFSIMRSFGWSPLGRQLPSPTLIIL